MTRKLHFGKALPAWIERHGLGVAFWAVAKPRRALAVWALVTLLPLPGLLRLRFDTDGRALVPRGDPAVRTDAAWRGHFHLRDQLIVHFQSTHPDGAFNPETLRSVVATTDFLAAQPEIGPGHVLSLATEKRDRLLPGSSASFVSFLEPFPSSPHEMATLRRDVASPAARIYLGLLVSEDRTAAAVLAGVDGSSRNRSGVYRRIERAVRPTASPRDRVAIVGAPAAEALLGDHVLADLAALVPIAMLALAGILWLGTRRLACVLLALGKAGSAIVWTFAASACIGIPVYLTTAVLPVVLAAMSLADEIHLLLGYQTHLGSGLPSRAAVERTFKALVTPVVLATTTSAAGLLSLSAAPIAPIRAFGLAAALGVVYSLGFSLMVTPALLAIWPSRWFARPPARTGLDAAKLVSRAIRRPLLPLGVIAALTLVAAAGLPRLAVHDSWIESFAKHSPFRKATEAVDRSLNGTHILHAVLSFSDQGGTPRAACSEASVVALVGDFEDFLRRQPGVGGVSGLHSQLTALANFWSPGAVEETLRSPREIRRLLSRFELSPGLLRRRQVVDDAASSTAVTVYLENANYRDTGALLARIRAYHDRVFAPLGSSLSFAGDVAVSQATIPAIVRTQVVSLPIAVLTVFLIIGLLYGSLRLAWSALLPIAVSAVWLLGALGWLGLPLSIATSMFFAIALGLGVDSQSIHFLDRYRQLSEAGDPEAVIHTVKAAGPAIALNTLTLAVGFGLLAFSSVPANARLGLLIAVALILGGLLTVVGLGALFASSTYSKGGSHHERMVGSLCGASPARDRFAGPRARGTEVGLSAESREA